MASGWNIPVTVCRNKVTTDDILKLKPRLVINDILNTDLDFMDALVRECKVVNFEDLGNGAASAHATINDLYEEPVAAVSNGFWGHDYYFLREEFESAVPRPCPETVKEVLLTFGGTDPNDLTRQVLRTVVPICRNNNIKINLVTGSGYGRLPELKKELKSLSAADIDHIHRTGIMSSIMERSDIAISSNGRTTYELSHMHIPSIVICHHEREAMHAFAREENGFVNLGVFGGEDTLQALSRKITRIIEDDDYRIELYNAMKKRDFRKNKQRVLDIITALVEET
jgi:spore coat polysaccharide biosynthesis predicted glycosyltransferase SpsG